MKQFLLFLLIATTASAGTGYIVTRNAEESFRQFLQLYDTPESYTGSGGLVVLVNAGATALEFGVVPSHVHDGDTLELDAVNSDGGAFAFNTTGDVTFNQSIEAVGLTITPSGGGFLLLESGDLLLKESDSGFLEFETTAAVNQIIYLNASGNLSFEAGFEYDAATDILTVPTLTLTGSTDSEVFYSNSGVVDGDSTFTFNDVTKVVTIRGIGDGGITNYDLKVGDTDGSPTYGMIQMGDAVIGRTSYKLGNIDLDGTILVRNISGPVTSDIEFVWTESTGNTCRFALPKAAVGNATYNSRSMLLAGPAPADTDFVKVSYWQGQGIFGNLTCDTIGTGADLGVQNDLEVEGDIFVDSIKESTSGSGVTIADNVIIGDGTAGVDFTVTFDGETNDGLLTWMEDEDRFDFADAVLVTGFHIAITTKTDTDYTATINDDVILVSTGAVTRTITLAAASGLTGKKYYIKKIDSGVGLVTVDPDGSETIDGDLTPDITIQYESWTLISDGSNWHVL